MNCKEFENNLAELFDEQADPVLISQMQEHMKSCTACTAAYEEAKTIINSLKPSVTFTSSGSGLKQRILNQTKMEELNMETVQKEKFNLKPWHKKAMAIAAGLALLLAVFMVSERNPFVNTAKAAENIMTKSVTAMESLRSMFVTMEVRSPDKEPFDYIDTKSDFIEYKFWKQFTGDKPWRIEKQGRIVVFDGQKQYLYIPATGSALTAPEEVNFIDWMKIFLDPKEIMEKEIEFSKQYHAEYKTEKTKDEIILTVNADALGDFHNNYLKNSSVSESDNTRIYTFDKKSMLLKTFELYVNSTGKSVKVIDLKNIAYNIPIPATTFAIRLPEGVIWQEMDTPGYVKEFTGITSKKAAQKFFKALSKEDYEAIAAVWDVLQITDKAKLAELKDYYGGLDVIHIGEPFKSGLYPGEFVPYKVKLKSGEILDSNLALRNDNPTKTWEIDGGI